MLSDVWTGKTTFLTDTKLYVKYKNPVNKIVIEDPVENVSFVLNC